MHFAKARAIKKPTQLATISASLYVALFFVVAAALQLFAFESFPGVIESYGSPFTGGLAPVLAAAIVCLEILAIPYLLWMKLSRLMRAVSLASGCLALLYWLVIGIWQSITDVEITNAGLFGAKVVLPQGWWLVSYCVVLLVLMSYLTWSSRSLAHSKTSL